MLQSEEAMQRREIIHLLALAPHTNSQLASHLQSSMEINPKVTEQVRQCSAIYTFQVYHSSLIYWEQDDLVVQGSNLFDTGSSVISQFKRSLAAVSEGSKSWFLC